jgi:hypothetical protein
VGWMICISPIDGCPAAALESEWLTAVGLPPDSRWMMFCTAEELSCEPE